MRKALVVAPLLLTACSSSPPAANATPVHGVAAGHNCTADGTAEFIGQEATEATADAILRASNAAVLRWAPPGVMLTMDYREDRVTIWLDPARKITKVRCG